MDKESHSFPLIILVKMLESHAVLQQLILSAPVAVVAVDRHGRIVFSNTRLEEMFGFASSELIGQAVERLLPSALAELHVAHRTGFVQAPRARLMGVGIDLIGEHKDGKQFPIEVGLSHIQVEGQLLVMASIVDITLRKHTEALLEARVAERTQEIERRRQAAERVQEILAMINSGRSLPEILDMIAGQVFALLNADACAVIHLLPEGQTLEILHAWRLAESLYQSWQPAQAFASTSPVLRHLQEQQVLAIPDLLQAPLTSDEEINEHRQRLLQAGYQALLALPLQVQDQVYGSFTLLFVSPRQYSEDEITLAQTLAEQAALAIDNARYASETQQAAVSSERNRIAHDLHDSVTQTLFSASVIADVLPRLWERKPEEGQRRLQELRELTRGALAEMRNLLLELRPETLATVELAELLSQLATATTGRGRLPVHLRITTAGALPPAVRIAFFRIAQEALNNVIKHAEATEVTVQLDAQPTQAEMSVVDDGRGFAPTLTRGNHLGLTIMRERAAEIGAALQIESQPDSGTAITVRWSQS